MSDAVLVTQSEGVRTLTLNRPGSLNAFSLDVMGVFADRLEEAAADPETRVVVITGAGNAFSTGGDITFLRELPTMPPARAKEVVYGIFQRAPRAIRSMEKPVIAAVNGAAVGAGCEIALACDFRVASETARFGEVWIKLGCVPALGGMFLLPRIVGLTKATELILTGEIIDAQEALRIGLVNKVVPSADLPRAARELARILARGPARALAVAKAALNRGLASDLWAELETTVDAQIMCFATRDFAEGVRALLEKRQPKFTGE
ncbi:MAG: enoyl-CoA hydratase/isomerase family protein [Candidatus Methylomirabilia bacterium]